MKHYKIQKLSEADLTSLEKASAKGAGTAKEIRGLLKDIEKAGDTDLEELIELYTEMDESLYSIFEEEVGAKKDCAPCKDVAKKVRAKAARKTAAAKRTASKGVGSAARHKAKMHEDAMKMDASRRAKEKATAKPKKEWNADYNYFYATADAGKFDGTWNIDTAYSTEKEAMAVAKASGQAVHIVTVEDNVWNEALAENEGLTEQKLHDEVNDWSFAESGAFEILDTIYEPAKKATAKPAAKKRTASKPAAKKRTASKSTSKAKGPIRGAALAAKEKRVKREALIAKTLDRQDLKKLSESEVLAIARQYNDLRVNVKRDESTASKQRVSATPENLIRWMRNPGGFDLIGIDSARATTPTANLKMDVGSWFNRFVHNKKD